MPFFFNTNVSGTRIRFSDDTQQSNAANPIFCNRVINSQMRVAQRGPVAVSLNTLTFGGCDRFPIEVTGFTTFSGTLQQAGTSSLYVQELGNVTTTGSGVISFIHRIEQNNASDLFDCVVTLQVELYQNTGATISPVLRFIRPDIVGASGIDDWAGGSTIIASNTVSLPSGVRTKFVWTYSIDSENTLINYWNNTLGLGFTIDFPVDVVTGKYFQIGNVQLEKGIYPTDIEYIPLTIEQQRCQRYYNVVSVGFRNYGSTAADLASTIKWQQYMRIAPTVTKIRAGTLISNATTSTIDSITQVGARHYVNVSATGLAGISDEIIAADAELK